MHDADIGWLYCNIGDCDWKTPAGPSDLARHRYKHRYKEEKMNDQMEQVWRSKDGKVTGSKEEVEAYLKSKNPLSGMRFPYQPSLAGGIWGKGATVPMPEWSAELSAFVAFANLAPLIQEVLTTWNDVNAGASTNWRAIKLAGMDLPTQRLLLAYEEVLKQVPQ